ncbi:hypothetical protein LTR56_011772 [Elasticomyces elasticus]|nr:hypothetical protein LTR56_011772 [Elasticomyces elasticus]KAK3663306.1 hypothetical protein LTR22_005964 [Elasticomyces elasticus]KAK4929038.1 hypothetical protein LTR49_004235 [Elasticomyces elasticus]KAK5750360.1 hypothetical protein LTS12_019546 [Elasticomyces elasticus]
MTAFTEFLRLFIGLSPSPEPTPDADHFLGALRPRRALKNPARLPNTPTLSHRPALQKVQKRSSKPKAFKCPNCKARITLTANGHPSKRSSQRTISKATPKEIAAFYGTETSEERRKRLGKLNRLLSLYPPRPFSLRPRITRPERFADLTFPKRVPAALKRKATKPVRAAKKLPAAPKPKATKTAPVAKKVPWKGVCLYKGEARPKGVSKGWCLTKVEPRGEVSTGWCGTEDHGRSGSFEYPADAIVRRWKDGTTIVTDPRGTFESLGCGPPRPVTPTDEWLPYSG